MALYTNTEKNVSALHVPAYIPSSLLVISSPFMIVNHF